MNQQVTVTNSPEELAAELRAALESEKEPRAALAAARQRFNSARRDLKVAQRAARLADARIIEALRALDAAGIDPASVLIPPK
jgi:hypothetical protein